MIGLLTHRSLIFTYFLCAIGPAVSSTISKNPSSTITPSPTSTVNIASSLILKLDKRRQNAGNIYAFDPFNIIGNGGGSVESDQSSFFKTDSSTVRPTQTTQPTSEEASRYSKLPGLDTSTGVLNSTSIGSISTLSSISGPLDTVQETQKLPTTTRSTSSDTQSSSATLLPSDHANNSVSSSNINSWKTIGIGVISFVAILLFILGTAFHDSILRVLKQPFLSRKSSEEVLVPDWRRGSWRYKEDDDDINDKYGDIEEGPRIGVGGKGDYNFPLPPVSPFAPRQPPTTGAQLQTSTAGVNHSMKQSTPKTGNNGYSTLPSPPLTHCSQRNGIKVDKLTDPLKNKHVQSDTDAYGGIE